MKHRISIWAVTILGFVLILIILKIVFLLTAKPKITVDYVAEYNKFSQLKIYEPNENAAPYYQKAFDAFVDIPDSLFIIKYKQYKGRLTDFNSLEQKVLEKWLTLNSTAFGFFKTAANKPYYWLERKTENPRLGADYNNCIASIVISEIGPLRQLANAITWNAKLNASKGQFQSAFEDIIDCYKAGSQKCRSNFELSDQCNGLEIRKAAVENAFLLLDKSKSAIESKILKSFQDLLQAEIDNASYIPSVEAKKFLLFDGLQHLFLDNGKGTGRIAWSIVGFCDFTPPCTDLTSNTWGWCSKLKRRLNCFIGPTRNETAQKIEQTISLSNQMMTKTPWQIKNENRNYLEEIKNINQSNFFLALPTMGINPQGIYNLYYNTKVSSESLVTVLAILRIKINDGKFPETLNDIVSKGFLKAIPQDPYSNGAILYKPIDGSFKLYSTGPDFKDDGGIDESNDIIFWSVKELKEPESKRQIRSKGKR